MIFRVLILLTCAVNLGCSVTVELYSGQNYSGLLKRFTMTQEYEAYCMEFDQTYEVKSLKTEKCIMVYETGNCKRNYTNLQEGSKLYSMRVEKDTALFDIDGAYRNRKEERGVQSFHLCDIGMGGWFTGDAEVGGRLLNVDIYSGPFYTGALVASYEAVCECKNIPSYMSKGLKGEPFSIDNHGKNMYFYDKEDCGGQERFIPAGDSERSRYVTHLDSRAVVIRSFRPAGVLCPKLDALINKFTFSQGKLIREVVIRDTTLTLTNRQHAPVAELVDKNVSYTAEYTVAKAFTYIDTTRVKAGVLMVFDRHSDLLKLESTLQSSLEEHYQYPNTNQNRPTIAIYRVPTSEERVNKPACTTCTANILVQKYQGRPINYTTEAIVTGVAGVDKVSAEQISHFLPPGMKYVKKNDDYSVVVTVEGMMEVNDALSYLHTDCVPLPDCDPSLRVEL